MTDPAGADPVSPPDPSPRRRLPRPRGAVAAQRPRFQHRTRPAVPGDAPRARRRSPRSLLDGDVPAWLVLGYRELHQVTGDPGCSAATPGLWNQWDTIPDDWPLLPMIGRQPSILYTVGERHRGAPAMISDALDAGRPVRTARLRRAVRRRADRRVLRPAARPT